MISPGFLTAADARRIAEAVDQAERTARALDNLLEQWVDEFPARITAWDATTQRASWTEEDFDQYGQRYVKPGGRTGDATYSPAFPVGNGLMPPDNFPVQVWLRRRVVALESHGSGSGSTLGPVYEFDWVCACGSPSGSGSGTTGALVPCCPGALPETLSVVMGVQSGTCTDFNALPSFVITYDGTSSWVGTFATAGDTWTFTLLCSASMWLASLQSAGGCSTMWSSVTTVSCSPLSLEALNGTLTGTCPGSCTGAKLLFQVVE